MRRMTPLAIAAVLLAAAPALGQTPRDHLKCYKIKPTKSVCADGVNDGQPCRNDAGCPGGTCVRLPKFVRGISVGLNDTLSPTNPQGLDPATKPGEDFTYDVRKPTDLCAPAGVDGQPIEDPQGLMGTHWLTYQIKQARGACAGDPGRACKRLDDCLSAAVAGPCLLFDEKFDRKAPRNAGVRVRDAYTDILLDFTKEDSLMVPASEDATAFQGVPSQEFFKCYRVKPTRSACAGGNNDGQACRSDADCPLGACLQLPKFPKVTHPDGLSFSLVDQFTTMQDPFGDDPEKTFDVRKIRTYCQAVDKKSLHFPENLRIAEQAGLLCYQAKAAKRKCSAAAPLNQLASCKREEDCGGIRRVTSFCVELDPKFDKKDPNVAGRYVDDDIFFWVGTRADVSKENLVCNPACRGFGDFALTPLIARVNQLALGVDGNPGSGVDVDEDAGTCAPQLNCSGGIDNQLSGIAAILNPLLAEQLDAGALNLLFQADELINGTTVISGFIGELATPAGCAAGNPDDPNTYPVDPGNPNDPCNYVAQKSSFFPDVRDTCEEQALISLPVDIAGADTAPSASAEGGGAGSSFNLNLPFGEGFVLTANGVRVSATLQHDTTDIAEINGVLGGAVEHAVLVDAVRGLDDSCVGGPNDGQACDPLVPAQCPAPGSCQLAATIPFSSVTLADFLQQAFPPDIDFGPGGHCTGGSNLNEFCNDTLADCPDQGGGTSCDAAESVSLGLQFSATAAHVTSIE